MCLNIFVSNPVIIITVRELINLSFIQSLFLIAVALLLTICTGVCYARDFFCASSCMRLWVHHLASSRGCCNTERRKPSTLKGSGLSRPSHTVVVPICLQHNQNIPSQYPLVPRSSLQYNNNNMCLKTISSGVSFLIAQSCFRKCNIHIHNTSTGSVVQRISLLSRWSFQSRVVLESKVLSSVGNDRIMFKCWTKNPVTRLECQ